MQSNTSSKLASVYDVAQYVAEKIPSHSTYMKLQKVVYYSQIESLVACGRPLFEEKILAWDRGPVVREIFNKHQGKLYLEEDLCFGDASKLTDEHKAYINWAIDKYGDLNGDILSRLTHGEDPWRNTTRNKEITYKSMIDYYSNLDDDD